MKKILMIALCLGLMPMLFAATNTDATKTDAITPNHTQDHAFRVTNPTASPYDGPRSTPTLIDQIDLSPINATGYCWGITYDWEMDVLWVSQWNAAYPKVFAIQKTSPCTKVDSFTLGGGAPSYHLGMGFAGSGILYMAGYDANIYEINMTTGAGSVFRTLPWSSAEGLGFNSIDDAVYPGDWTANQCAWAQPAQSGAWNTWSLASVSGLTSAYSTSSPEYLFTVDENAAGATFYQHSLTAGVPNTTPDSTWDCDPGQTGASTADMAFDGQYVYILDQSGPDMIWVYDVGITAQSSFPWDFEDGWQGWTHTNGQAFPAGWSVEIDDYQPGWVCPSPGDSSFWIDSDAGGSAFWIQDTALSPAVVPPTNMAYLVYGVGFNGGGGSWVNDLYVGIYHFTSGAWTAVELQHYVNGADYVGWDTLDVSAYNTADSIRVFFYYDDLNTWGYWASFDNVGLYAPPDHDVGTIAINDPPATILPSTTINPSATYHNFGGVSETFDVYFSIDSAGTPLYLETVNVTVPASGNTTHVYTNTWTSGPGNGIVYDITAWTILSGDTDPANDTLTSTTTTQSAFWKTYASMPSASYYNAVVYSDVTGAQTVWNMGGNPTYTSIFEFDCATETWSTSSAVLNHEAQRTAAAVCMGKVYVMGGCDAGFTAHSYAQEFDPIAGTVIDVTAMPTARYFNGALCWNDTLIYVLGGQASTYYATVEIYDPANDAWTTGTAMPEANRSFACGIQNDTIYVTGGYSGSGYLTATRIGVIDPANPQSITWSSGPDIPIGASGTPGRSRLQGACVQVPGDSWNFYFTCGDDHGVVTYDTWHYAAGAWVQDLDKTTPISNSQCAVYVPNPLDGGVFFCAGGYNTASAGGTAATEGLINIGTGIFETPPINHGFTSFGFAAMANPSKGMISYVTSVSGRIVLKAYDATGRLVETLVNTVQPAGAKTVNWDTSNIANGVYFLKLEAQGETATHKMILVK